MGATTTLGDDGRLTGTRANDRAKEMPFDHPNGAAADPNGIELAARFNIVLMIVQLAIVTIFVALCWHYASAAAGPGGMAMADHDIHSTVVVGDKPAIGLALYGYALVRFPSVSWYVPQFNSVRTTPSRRHAAMA